MADILIVGGVLLGGGFVVMVFSFVGCLLIGAVMEVPLRPALVLCVGISTVVFGLGFAYRAPDFPAFVILLYYLLSLAVIGFCYYVERKSLRERKMA